MNKPFDEFDAKAAVWIVKLSFLFVMGVTVALVIESTLPEWAGLVIIISVAVAEGLLAASAYGLGQRGS